MRLHTVVTVLVILAAMSLSSAHAYREDAIEDTKQDFTTLKTSVDQANESLSQVADGLREVENFLHEANIDPQEKQLWLQRIQEASGALGTYTAPLQTFSKYAKHATSAFDIYDEVKQLRATVQQRRQTVGELSGQLTAIATAMEKWGGRVPVLGSAIEAYGQITLGLLSATDRISQLVDENRNQGEVGGQGYYPTGQTKPLYDKMVEQFGQDFAQGTRFVPGVPPHVFTPGFGSGPTLIWDTAAGEWYRVDSGIPVARIYKLNLLAGSRRSPWELKVLAERWEEGGKPRLELGAELHGLMNQMNNAWWGPLSDAWNAVNRQHSYGLSWELRDTEEFEAKFAYNNAFNNEMRQALREIYAHLLSQDTPEAREAAQRLKQWADQRGFSLPAPPDPDEDPAGDLPPEQVPDPADPDPAAPVDEDPTAQVERSVLFLVDCSGSMRGGKIEQARAAVVQSIQNSNDGTTEWALLRFSDCSVQVAHPFTTRPEGISRAAQTRLTAGGSTPLTLAIGKAMTYMYQNARGNRGLLVVLCDGEDNCCTANPREAGDTLRRLTRRVDLDPAAQP